MAEAAPLRIGVLGAARIAPPALIAPARATGVAVVAAVASRDRDRARAFAQTHEIPIVCDDYAALIADPRVDAVYNALPPARHAELSIAALRAGKPVLCEKPFALDAGEATAMVAAAEASGQVLMEAFHYRYHPLFARVLEILASGEIGRVSRIAALFQTTIAASPSEIRYRPELGGGALMDLGTYCLHWCRALEGAEPKVTHAECLLGETGVDIWTRATLAFPSGTVADVCCDMAAVFKAELVIEGAKGTMKVVNPLAPQLGHRIEVAGETPRRETVSREPTYDFQLRAFVDAVRGGPAPLTAGADSIAQMRLLDEVKQVSRAGG